MDFLNFKQTNVTPSVEMLRSFLKMIEAQTNVLSQQRLLQERSKPKAPFPMKNEFIADFLKSIRPIPFNNALLNGSLNRQGPKKAPLCTQRGQKGSKMKSAVLHKMKESRLPNRELTEDQIDDILYQRMEWTSCKNLDQFKRGNLVKLVNGRLRPIEDLRMEDFNTSWQNLCHMRLSNIQNFRLCWARVTRISPLAPGNYKITFTVHPGRKRAFKFESAYQREEFLKSKIFNKKSTVHLESTSAQVFFVFAESWASLNPVESFERLGLICKRLQTGDDCMILLRKAEPGSRSGSRVDTESFDLSNEQPFDGDLHGTESVMKQVKCPFTASFLADEKE